MPAGRLRRLHGAHRRRAAALVPGRRWRPSRARGSRRSRASATPDELSPVQAAFHEHYAAQCGFCTSGFVMAAAGARRARRRRDRARGGDRGARRPPVPLHGLREDRRRGHGRRPRRRLAPRTRRPTPIRRATTPSPWSRGARHEGRRRPPAPLRRHRPRHGPHTVRRRRPRPRHPVVQGAALAAPQRAHPSRSTRAKARALPGVHAIVTHEDVPHNVYGHLEAPRRAGRRAAAGRRRRALEGPADRRRRRRVRGGRAGRGRGDRDRRSRSASRSSTSAPPPTPAPASTSTSGARSIRTSARTTTAACARATSRPPSTRPTSSSRASTARRRSSTARWRRRSRSWSPSPAAG